jgi:hypothetical protein
MVTITKTGTGAIELEQPVSVSVNYDISELSTTTLSADGATATFWIQPKADLPAGTYNETITIIGSGTSAPIDVSFTVMPPDVTPIDVAVQQSYVYGSYYFAPVDLLWLPGYTYKIVSRPDTIGGKAPMINAYGQFVFARQVAPVNISRDGVYVVEVYDSIGNVVAVYRIVVS